jgi:hypothetical protein
MAGDRWMDPCIDRRPTRPHMPGEINDISRARTEHGHVDPRPQVQARDKGAPAAGLVPVSSMPGFSSLSLTTNHEAATARFLENSKWPNREGGRPCCKGNLGSGARPCCRKLRGGELRLCSVPFPEKGRRRDARSAGEIGFRSPPPWVRSAMLRAVRFLTILRALDVIQRCVRACSSSSGRKRVGVGCPRRVLESCDRR